MNLSVDDNNVQKVLRVWTVLKAVGLQNAENLITPKENKSIKRTDIISF